MRRRGKKVLILLLAAGLLAGAAFGYINANLRPVLAGLTSRSEEHTV